MYYKFIRRIGSAMMKKKRYFLATISLVIFSMVSCNKTENTHTHTFDNPVWSWEETSNEDGYVAKVTLSCTGCDEKAVVDATITHTTVNPTCENDGSITYTATATYNGKTVTDSKTDSLQKLGHSFDALVVEGNYKKSYVALEPFDSANLVVKGKCTREGCGETITLTEDDYFIIYQTQGVDHLCAGDTKVIISANYAPFASYEITGLTVSKIPNSITGMESSYETTCHHAPDLSGVTATSGNLELKYYADSGYTEEITLDNLSVGTYYIKAIAGDNNYGIVTETATLTVSHVFDQCVSEDEYLYAAANEFDNAIYYKSCACGASSTSLDDLFELSNSKLPDLVAKSALDGYEVVEDMNAPMGYQVVTKSSITYGNDKQSYGFLGNLDLYAIEEKAYFMILTKNGALCQNDWSQGSVLTEDKWYSVEITKNEDLTYSSTIKDENGNIKIQYSNKPSIGGGPGSTVLPFYHWGETDTDIYSTEVYGYRYNDETFDTLVSDSAVPSYTVTDIISPIGFKTVTLNNKTFVDSDQGKVFLKDIAIDNYQSVSFAFKTKNRRFCKSDWSAPLPVDTWYICTFELNSGGAYDCVISTLTGETKITYENVTSFSGGILYYNWDGSAPALEWYSTEVRGVLKS